MFWVGTGKTGEEGKATATNLPATTHYTMAYTTLCLSASHPTYHLTTFCAFHLYHALKRILHGHALFTCTLCARTLLPSVPLLLPFLSLYLPSLYAYCYLPLIVLYCILLVVPPLLPLRAAFPLTNFCADHRCVFVTWFRHSIPDAFYRVPLFAAAWPLAARHGVYFVRISCFTTLHRAPLPLRCALLVLRIVYVCAFVPFRFICDVALFAYRFHSVAYQNDAARATAFIASLRTLLPFILAVHHPARLFVVMFAAFLAGGAASYVRRCFVCVGGPLNACARSSNVATCRTRASAPRTLAFLRAVPPRSRYRFVTYPHLV